MIMKLCRCFTTTIILHQFLFAFSIAQSWKYLGQNPPGTQPERFPPENLLAKTDWNWHSAPVFSPDGTEMFFAKFYSADGRLELNHIELVDSQWAEPAVPSFADTNYLENCPVFSPGGGDTLYFRSSRPGGTIFLTTKSNGQWSDPVAVSIPFPDGSFIGWQFAVTGDKSVYFEIWENGQVDIYYSKFSNGNYQTPNPLPSPLNTQYFDFGPFVDHDNKFLIFVSNRPGGYGFNDLYISNKNDDGTWSEAINLGAIINSDFEDGYPLITFDKKYFFFTTQKPGDLGYNPYWVDAQVVYALITDVAEKPDSKVIPDNVELMQNYPNPFNSSTNIRFNLSNPSKGSIEIYNIQGKLVRTLSSGQIWRSGYHIVTWNGKDELGNEVSSGLYFLKMHIKGFNEIQKMTLIK